MKSHSEIEAAVAELMSSRMRKLEEEMFSRAMTSTILTASLPPPAPGTLTLEKPPMTLVGYDMGRRGGDEAVLAAYERRLHGRISMLFDYGFTPMRFNPMVAITNIMDSARPRVFFPPRPPLGRCGGKAKRRRWARRVASLKGRRFVW